MIFPYMPSASVAPSMWETSIHKRQNYTSVYLILYIFLKQTQRQRILHQMIVSIPLPDFKLLLICSLMQLWFVTVVPINMNCSPLWKQLLSIFTLWFCPACSWWHMKVHFVFSTFTSQPISLLETNKTSVFFFIVCNGFTQYTNTISTNQKLMCTI
jgi:hypothetical protein